MISKWAVSANNVLKNVHGYSPNQLVFGKNNNHPCAENGKLPALENRTSSQIVADNLNTLHAARENYIKSESSEKLKRALKYNVRTHSETVFNTGDVVFYKRSREKQWKGPATVIGSDNQQIVLKHGSFTIRVHSSNVTLRKSAYSLENDPPLNEQRMNINHSSELSAEADEFHPENIDNIAPKNVSFNPVVQINNDILDLNNPTFASSDAEINSANDSIHHSDAQCYDNTQQSNIDNQISSESDTNDISQILRG